jgi:hypothetical protein
VPGTKEPEIAQRHDHRNAGVQTRHDRRPGQLHAVHDVDDVRLKRSQFVTYHLGRKRVVVLSSCRVFRHGEVEVNLHEGHALVQRTLDVKLPGMGHGRFHGGDDPGVVSGTQETFDQSAEVHFGAADVTREVLMGEKQNLHPRTWRPVAPAASAFSETGVAYRPKGVRARTTREPFPIVNFLETNLPAR